MNENVETQVQEVESDEEERYISPEIQAAMDGEQVVFTSTILDESVPADDDED
jgi:hypothetical protein